MYEAFVGVLGEKNIPGGLNLIPRTKTRDKPKDELNPIFNKA